MSGGGTKRTEVGFSTDVSLPLYPTEITSRRFLRGIRPGAGCLHNSRSRVTPQVRAPAASCDTINKKCVSKTYPANLLSLKIISQPLSARARAVGRDYIGFFPFPVEGDQGGLGEISGGDRNQTRSTLSRALGPQRVHSCSKTPILSFLRLSLSITMVAKPKSTSAPADPDVAPRRSARIKEQPKVEPEPAPKKAPTKPRSKKSKADEKEEKSAGEESAAPPKSRGKKRKAADAEEDEPPAKKVRIDRHPFDILDLRGFPKD